MKKLLLLIPLISVLISCSKDNSQNCPIVGKWCDPTLDCFIYLEFNSNGDHYITGGRVGKWESDDCTTIHILDNAGNKFLKYTVISISGNILKINRGGGEEEYVKK